MLVFTLKHGQSFRIGKDIKITCIPTNSQEALLSIQAPRYIKFRKMDQREEPK